MTSTPGQRRGRPLMFLASLCLGWVLLRVAILALWPLEPVTYAPNAEMVMADQLLASSKQTLAPEGADGDRSQDKPAREAGAALADEKGDPVHSASAELIGLDPAPLTHLEGDLGAPSAAGAHATLWIAASGSYDAAPGGSGATVSQDDGGDSEKEIAQ